MTIYFVFAIADSTVSSGTPFRAGLTPVIAILESTGVSPGVDLSAHAAITPIGGGLYQIAYDPETYGEAAGIIDCTSSLTTNTDRYLPIFLARDSSRIQTTLNATGQAGLDFTNIKQATAATTLSNITIPLVTTVSTVTGGATAANQTTLSTQIGTPAQANQIPANFTSALFASAGVFSSGALANAPSGGGSSGMATGTIVAGSTTSAVIVSGLPSGNNYAGQHLYQPVTGEARTIASQTVAGGNYTFSFTGATGTESGPFSTVTTGATVAPCP